MATGTITNTILDPNGNPIPGASVQILLQPPDVPAFSVDGHQVMGSYAPTVDGSGHWSATLEQTGTMTVGGMYYLAIERTPGRVPSEIPFTVPAGTNTLSSVALPTIPSTGGTFAGVSMITSADGSVTITHPAGPSTDLSVIGGGGGVPGVWSAKAYGFLLGSSNATANGTKLTAWFAAAYALGGGVLDFSDMGGDVYFPPTRIVVPNSTGGTFIGAIGSAAPQQPYFKLRGRRSANGLSSVRLVLPYVSANPVSSAGTLSGTTGAVTCTVTGTAIPQGSFDVGAPVQIQTGTQQETVQVTGVTLSGGHITAFTVTLGLTGYSTGAAAATIGWPLRNDAKIVTLGQGDLDLEDLTLLAPQGVADTTAFLLTTGTCVRTRHCEFIGANGATVTPLALQTGKYPTQDGIIFGGTSALPDGSLTGAFLGYGSEVTSKTEFNQVRSPVVLQTFGDTITVDNIVVASNCGSPHQLGGAVEAYTASPINSNGNTFRGSQIEMVNYANGYWFGNLVRSNRIDGGELPDALGSIKTTANASGGDTTLTTDGYLPEQEIAPFLYSYDYVIGNHGKQQAIRFTGAPTPAHTTTLSGAVSAGANSIVVASATGISAGSVVLLDHGTYGLQEPVVVAASYVSGTTLPLVTGLVFAHGNGAAAWVGPFVHTLTAPLVQFYNTGAFVLTQTAGIRFEAGAAGTIVNMPASDVGFFVRDFNAFVSNTVWMADPAQGSALAAGLATHLEFSGGPQFPPGAFYSLGAMLGTSPPTPQMMTTSGLVGQDNRFIVGFGTGSATPAGDGVVIVIAFNKQWQFTPVAIVEPANAATAALAGGWHAVANQSTVTIHFTGILAASQAANTYQLAVLLL